MKKHKSTILIGVGLVLLLATAACKKSEKFPVNHVTIGYVFDSRDSDGVNAHAYLLSVYSIMKNGQNRVNGDYLDAASDDAVSSVTGGQVSILATGSYNAASLPSGEDVWTVDKTGGLNGDTSSTHSYWSGIRYATEFIDNIGVVPVKDAVNKTNGEINGIGVSNRYIWKSEARFLRAYFYFELVKRYGGVPLLGNKVYGINDNILLPRNSFADCIKYILSECDAIKDSLITVQTYNSSADNYRVTQGADMALKAHVLLYAASPLFNDPSNSNPLTGYVGSDVSPTHWADAAAAANDVMKLGVYRLDTSYTKVFLTNNDPEVIFIRENDGPTNSSNVYQVEKSNAPVGFPAAISSGVTSPTQQLVDSYPMINGKAITDPTSTYDSQNPYANRDPRLGYNILYNGAPWLGVSLQTFNGGQSRPGSGQETQTGYYTDKFFSDQERTGTNFVSHIEDWVIFRYAEMMLDYAEAQNEVGGPTSVAPAGTFTPYQIIDSIRRRAGISPGTDGMFGLAQGMSKDQMRAVIQNERRIEMPFEEQRYFDIRRWKIAATVMNTPMMGVSIQNAGGTLTYNYVPVLTTRFIAPKMYLYPIPYAEVIKDPQLKQNPGW